MANLKYTKSHEWITAEGDSRKVGITDFAQDKLGDIVYVEFPLEEGETFEAGDEICVIESCKATASVYAPLPGTLKATNNDLEDSPETVNQSPTENGWLIEFSPSSTDGEDELLDDAAYKELCAEDE